MWGGEDGKYVYLIIDKYIVCRQYYTNILYSSWSLYG